MLLKVQKILFRNGKCLLKLRKLYYGLGRASWGPDNFVLDWKGLLLTQKCLFWTAKRFSKLRIFFLGMKSASWGSENLSFGMESVCWGSDWKVLLMILNISFRTGKFWLKNFCYGLECVSWFYTHRPFDAPKHGVLKKSVKNPKLRPIEVYKIFKTSQI